MEIVRGSGADIEVITDFQVAMAMESEGVRLNPEVVRRGVAAAIADPEKGRYIIARHAGKPRGSLMITREWSDWNCCWYWWIQSVYILPEHRGQGVYKAMYHHVVELAREEGVRQIRLYADKNNLTAQSVYSRLGMEECHYTMFEAEL